MRFDKRRTAKAFALTETSTLKKVLYCSHEDLRMPINIQREHEYIRNSFRTVNRKSRAASVIT